MSVPHRPIPALPSRAAVHDLPDRFSTAWTDLSIPPSWRRVLVAVSGGPDSLALLHLLKATQGNHRLDLIVAHADHGIHPSSGAVADGVVRAADGLGIPANVGRLNLGAATSETGARVARLAWLERVRHTEGADAIVLAHHQDDQVETILMRVLAGSGPAGLAGMHPVHGSRVRPLLGFKKRELLAWLESRGIAGWTDPANSDPAHTRSWVRSVLLPTLEERADGTGDRLLRLGRQAVDARHAWDAALDIAPRLDVQASPNRISVAALPLATYDSALAAALLQAAARRIGCVLGTGRAARTLGLARGGRSGGRLELGADWHVELAFGRICFYRTQAIHLPLRLTGDRGLTQWGPWQVSWSRGPATRPQQRDGWVGWFIGEEAVLRGSVPGDKLAPLGGVGQRGVVRILQEARVERSRRAGWPLLEQNGSIVWVAGLCRGQGSLPDDGDDGLRIEVSGG